MVDLQNLAVAKVIQLYVYIYGASQMVLVVKRKILLPMQETEEMWV